MKKQYEVELSITKKYNVIVTVEGEFSGKGDPDIEKAAVKAAENMDHGDWDYLDTEYEVNFIE
ncbi:hypothetical protein [Staphylococcus warneri]|uniref:hypothetical protein n=1 Tax=Staphylococcus warneri TaxID=1292 RepID=UPI003BA2C3BC